MLIQLLASVSLPLIAHQGSASQPITRTAPPPAPTIAIAPPAPLLVPTPPPRQSYETRLLEVEVRAGAEILWNGTLRVGSSRSASFTRDVSQAPEGDCALPAYARNAEQTSLRVSVALQPNHDGAARIAVGARWQRPSGAGCQQQGSRTVELSEMVDLASGAWQTVRGDGDLIVRIRRR